MKWVLLLSILATNIFFFEGALAQDTEPSDYSELVRQAIEEFEAHRFDEARSLFRRAHAIKPNARTLRGLGIASYEGSDYVNTIKYLQQALKDKRNSLTDKQRTEAKDLLLKSNGFIGRFRIVLKPYNARLSIDGIPTELKGSELLVNPGERTIIATADGYKTLELDVVARSGITTNLEINLESIESSEKKQGRLTERGANWKKDSSYSKPIAPYIIMGAGGVLLIGSLITGLLTEAARNELLEKCDKNYNCDPSLKSTSDSGEALRTTTYILTFTGATTVATGAVLLFLLGDENEENMSQTVSFTCSPEGCSGAFHQPF